MLYGDILKCFAGEITPVDMGVIRKITSKRNGLIHTVVKPDKVNLANDDIKKYRAATEIALFHLWLDLYPYDECVIVKYRGLLERNPSLVRKDYYPPKKASSLDTA